MNDWLLISTAILIISIVIGILAVVFVWTKKKKGTDKEPNYHAFYIMGIVMLFIGLGFVVISLLLDYSFIVSTPIFTIGVVYLVIGLSHKDISKKKY